MILKGHMLNSSFLLKGDLQYLQQNACRQNAIQNFQILIDTKNTNEMLRKGLFYIKHQIAAMKDHLSLISHISITVHDWYQFNIANQIESMNR